jgi:carbamate kinase
VGVDVFLIATDVAGAYLDYGTPAQRMIEAMSVDAAERHLREGRFPPGSMGPKVEAAAQFIRNRGGRAVITSTDRIEQAVKGEAGTRILDGKGA